MESPPPSPSPSPSPSSSTTTESAQLIDNGPNNDISLFSIIEAGDPIDEVLTNMVSVTKDSGQIDNQIRIHKSYQKRFPAESQETLDNVLGLYKVNKAEDISNSNDSPYMKANHAAKVKKTEDISNSNDSPYMKANHAAKAKDTEDISNSNDSVYMKAKHAAAEAKDTQDISNSNDSPYMKAKHAAEVKKTEDISSSNDSLYMKAKHAEMEKDLEEARRLYYSALRKHDDRIDSVVKDLANVLRQLGRTDEAISVIKDNAKVCSRQSQNSLDNLLISIYKSDHTKTAEHINFLEKKLELVENGTTFEGKETKVVKVKKKKNRVKAGRQDIDISFDRTRARLLSEIAWLYMLQGNYDTAEIYLRKSLSIEPFKNNQCNLAICLIKSERISEAKDLLQAVTASSNERETPDTYIKSYDRAWKMLAEFEKGDV